jgi:Pyridine nucleotide-disulphide oxidoreductase
MVAWPVSTRVNSPDKTTLPSSKLSLMRQSGPPPARAIKAGDRRARQPGQSLDRNPVERYAFRSSGAAAGTEREARKGAAMPEFDAIIIGTGQAGPSLARRLAAADKRVAIIERKRFCGTCVNTGCTPTKTMVASAYAARVANRAAEYGVMIDGRVTVDMKRVSRASDMALGTIPLIVVLGILQ